MKKWKILKETDVSPSKWFPVTQQTVQLPNGTVIDDYFISPMGNVAMVLPILNDGRIVFVKQYKHAIGEILIELPAGFQQKEKTIKESALAELEEETGIKTTLENLDLLGKVCNNSTKTTHVTYCYLAKGLEFNSAQQLDSTEEIEILKVAPKEALKMVKDGQIWSGDTVFALMMAHLKHPELFV